MKYDSTWVKSFTRGFRLLPIDGVWCSQGASLPLRFLKSNGILAIYISPEIRFKLDQLKLPLSAVESACS